MFGMAARIINEGVNVYPFVDLTGNVGNFVSEYMAYHVCWYRDFSQNEFANDPDKQCLIAGHTHVGIQVSPSDGMMAVEVQLEELFRALP